MLTSMIWRRSRPARARPRARGVVAGLISLRNFGRAGDVGALADIDEVEIDLAIAGIVDVGRQRQRLVGRPERAGDPALAAVLLCLAVGDLADDPGAGEVDVADQSFGAVIGLADPVGVEAVGGEDVGAGIGEALAISRDEIGLGEVQKVVIALLVARRGRGRRDNRPRAAGAPGSACRRRRP
jgi:hypothetical protein